MTGVNTSDNARGSKSMCGRKHSTGLWFYKGGARQCRDVQDGLSTCRELLALAL
jgi:hypothetical protein